MTFGSPICQRDLETPGPTEPFVPPVPPTTTYSVTSGPIESSTEPPTTIDPGTTSTTEPPTTIDPITRGRA